ncbi:hypothetical protein [Hymenobacter negativus]|uniref:Uncharacterized protein n=1 Tax=Hymenobacter negativus TaxID=2795026 RepID=A0ABS3QA20_9BACT|nr:hypothetical protein [Hymenobacter negativus]MBO2008081.1 hypothetical protein [Hymenobacter negativus]
MNIDLLKITAMCKFIARHTCLLLVIILTSCEVRSTNKNAEGRGIEYPKVDSTAIVHTDVSTKQALVDDTTDYSNADYATYYIVVADTSFDYHILHKEMFSLSNQLSIPIDTMGRLYNKTKNLIALPDNDEDEMYAGDYFPRRTLSENLSLEYLNCYQKHAGEKTIALVAGIYETDKSADSVATVLRKVEKGAFKIKSTIYVGCMH